MKSSRALVRCVKFGLLACCLAVSVCFAGAAAAQETASQTDFDLSVLVLVPDLGPAQVALSYSKLVDHKALGAAISKIAQNTGASVSGLQIKDARQARGLSASATAAEFTIQGLVNPRGGALPVGPIIRALPEWRRLRLVFLVSEAFVFLGPTQATADGFSIRLVNRMKPYEYDVERSSREAAPTKAAAVEKKQVSTALLPAIIIGLPAGFLVGWLLSDVKLKGTPATGAAARKTPRAR